jgi:hypothetical protein
LTVWILLEKVYTPLFLVKVMPASCAEHLSSSPAQAKSRDNPHRETFTNLNLAITGIGVQYPPYAIDSSGLESIAKRHYPETPA